MRIQHFRRAIAIDPGFCHAHCNLGMLLENHKEDDGGADAKWHGGVR